VSPCVVDASVVAKWFLPEVHTAAALRVLEAGRELHAPDFLLLELDNVFCKRIRRGELTEKDGAGARDLLRRLPVTMHPFRQLQDLAYETALVTGRSMYDCLYVALAVLLDGQVVTADHRLYKAMAGGVLAENLLWVEDIH